MHIIATKFEICYSTYCLPRRVQWLICPTVAHCLPSASIEMSCWTLTALQVCDIPYLHVLPDALGYMYQSSTCSKIFTANLLCNRAYIRSTVRTILTAVHVCQVTCALVYVELKSVRCTWRVSLLPLYTQIYWIAGVSTTVIQSQRSYVAGNGCIHRSYQEYAAMS